MESYADYTYNAHNKLKRFSHRQRFKKSVESIPLDKPIKLLDFGCGDGLFLNYLNATLQGKKFLMGFEPFLQSIHGNTVNITADWSEVVKAAPFDYVTCFEVLEHFDERMQIETLEKMKNILNDSGFLIISVPIEMGMPSLVKNIIRKFSSSKKERPIYTFKNIIASFFKRKRPQYRQNSDYLSHMGFYFTDLEKIFTREFCIVEKGYSPISFLGWQFNSQVFYQLTKKR